MKNNPKVIIVNLEKSFTTMKDHSPPRETLFPISLIYFSFLLNLRMWVGGNLKLIYFDYIHGAETADDILQVLILILFNANSF